MFVFFDIDRVLEPHEQVSNDDILKPFVTLLTAYLKEVYAWDITLEEGVNYHVSTSSRKGKLSLHIKLNILSPNMTTLREFVQQFTSFISNNAVVPTEYSDALHYMKEDKTGKKSLVCVVDLNPYNGFQAIRCLYSCKMSREVEKQVPLIPYGNSSKEIEDHLVIAYKEHKQKVLNTIYSKKYKPNMSIKLCKINDIVMEHKRIPVECDKQQAFQPTIPMRHIDLVRKWITESAQIKEVMGGSLNITAEAFKQANLYHFYLDNACPYACRKHKRNRIFLEYKYPTNIITLICYDSDCIEACKTQGGRHLFTVTQRKDYFINFAALTTQKTLHCKQDVIEWDENYPLKDKMYPYPVKPLGAVAANMGQGKTNEAIKFIDTKVGTKDKCLFITFSRSLSRKYINQLKGLGFINYLDCEGSSITDDRVIVCLDSLWKVKTDNFQYVFIDEILSVLMHFNSNMMQKRGLVCMCFELILLQAKHIYLMDACVDNTLVYNFVEYIADRKNVKPYWIRNHYVRPSNRKCNIVDVTKTSSKKSSDSLACELTFMRIQDILAEGKKVVVASSTKSFTEKLEMMLSKHTKSNVLVYNSSTDQEIMNDHAQRPNEVWSKYDVLIYSPSISAGMSFELLHFNELIAYLDNGFNTPTVDIALQMLFRVRQLIDGNMTIYVKSPTFSTDLPDTEMQVAQWLDNDLCTFNQYISMAADCPTSIHKG